MLLCLSLDHTGSALPLREAVSRRTEQVTAAFADFCSGSVVLSTCNRFEVYLDGGEAGISAESAVQRLAEASEVSAPELWDASRIASDGEAAEHLFAVASGLESAALGEEEISGQVRRAHTNAREAQTITDRLERLFQTATRTSRAVRERTGIRSAGQSLVRLSLVLAERRIPQWANASVLLIGTGAYAGATVAALRDRGARDIHVHSPSGRAAAFAESHDLTAVNPEAIIPALTRADLVIACSAAQDPLLRVADFAHMVGQSQLILDLGMPRNIDPAVAAVPGVELLDLDLVARHAPVPELSAAAEARDLVRDAAAAFATDQAERVIGPTLTQLRGHVLAILEEEICRARGGEGDASRTASPGDADVEQALRRFTGRLLHEPTSRLRALARAGRVEEAQAAAHALFGIGS